MLSSNDPTRKSWVAVAPQSDFPIQNLPFGIFRTTDRAPVAGVAIGDYVVDLAHLQDHAFFDAIELPNNIFHQKYLNDFLSLGRKKIRAVRETISNLLKTENHVLRDHASRKIALIPMHDVEMMMPVRIANYTDFYSSEEHATNVGTMFRDPKNALLPNWKHLPVGYHGRASSIVINGTPVRRPKGQIKLPDSESPIFGPSRKLDFELEVAFITCGENEMGTSITTDHAEDMIAGLVLFNDWSARDIQQWEYVPLGPFLSKNFASTISPWIVTLDALEPFRVEGPKQDPPVLPYLQYAGAKNIDLHLDVFVKVKGSEDTVISRSNFKYMYWNMAQQLAHHTVNGCNIQVGDLYASGTISGPTPGSYGSLLELSWNGQKPLEMSDGSTRTFLQDHDTLIIKGYAEKNGVRIGFGSCSGTVLPSN